jgi:hypothetical protein
MRHKEGHGINAHPSLKFAIDFGFSLIPEKYKKRIKVTHFLKLLIYEHTEVVHFLIKLMYILKEKTEWLSLLKYNYYEVQISIL